MPTEDASRDELVADRTEGGCMPRWMIAGSRGMLGRRLEALVPHASCVDLRELDLTDFEAVSAAVPGHDLLINAAAWTDVDGAEAHYEEALRINGDAVAHLAAVCRAARTRLIHISTDYVFDGRASTPYPEDAPAAPVNAYGRSKHVGEQAVLASGGTVVRTAWLYDTVGHNFLTTMLRLASERETVEVVDDQRGQPTWAHALAMRLVQLAEAGAPPGVFHATCAGETTWFGFAREIFRLSGLDPERVRPIGTADFPRAASRPAYSVLGHRRWYAVDMKPMPSWEEVLASALSESHVVT